MIYVLYTNEFVCLYAYVDGVDETRTNGNSDANDMNRLQTDDNPTNTHEMLGNSFVDAATRNAIQNNEAQTRYEEEEVDESGSDEEEEDDEDESGDVFGEESEEDVIPDQLIPPSKRRRIEKDTKPCNSKEDRFWLRCDDTMVEKTLIELLNISPSKLAHGSISLLHTPSKKISEVSPKYIETFEFHYIHFMMYLDLIIV